MRFDVWGVSGTLATQHERDAEFASSRLWYWLDRVDEACNRFRPDSEISRINAQPATTFEVSETMARCLQAALRSASVTNGLCDPTTLVALRALGYDRDFDELASATIDVTSSSPTPGIEAISFDEDTRLLALERGCELDRGARAKALVADLVVSELRERGGIVVEIGGDVALHGRGPSGPWVVGVSDSLHLTGKEPRVSLTSGGIATSSCTARTWRAGGRIMHHIIDPRTGVCAEGPYATATVSAEDCVTANAFATASLLWGEDASYHVAQAGWSARLVRHDGSVEFVGGWPQETLSA